MVFGLLLWLLLSVVTLLVYAVVRHWFDDFGMALPVLTRWLVHPMAPLMCWVIGAALALRGLMTRDHGERKHIGRLALGLGFITTVALVIGIVVPLYSLWAALQ